MFKIFRHIIQLVLLQFSWRRGSKDLMNQGGKGSRIREIWGRATVTNYNNGK